jgi:fructosamine-3-kinase
MSSPGLVEGVRDLLGVAVLSARPVGGGCISEARRVELADGRVVFAKSGADLPDDLLTVEAAGLRWLAEGGGVKVPAVVASSHDSGVGNNPGPPRSGHDGGARGGPGPPASEGAGRHTGAPVLVLEWIEPGVATSSTPERLGRGLARLHASGAPGFGWVRDGFIGSLPQRNTPLADEWPAFWVGHRIEPLARQAVERGSLSRDATALLARLGERLPDLAGPAEPPARLHGDLWSGNVVIGTGGEPWIVDPAPYGGHREVDLAMMRLFGGFSPAVFRAYGEEHPLAPGHEDRVPLYQLYPLLVHVVLFGAMYAARVDAALGRYVG